ncbi:MAG TPA: NlpC/P60 family protein, partial [Acidimicrobiales bacterium]|nr:NlpC/P60 family protein [Acidimicrobiales bacterium]
MAPPLSAVVGLLAGALGSGAVVLGVGVAGVALGPTASGPVGSTGPAGAATAGLGWAAGSPSGAAAVGPGLLAQAEGAAQTCPDLDWALLAAAVLVDGSLAAQLPAVATELCTLAPARRAGALAGLLPGPTQGEVALVLAVALGADPALGSAAAVAITFAAANLGAPYRWGGTGPGGFDCSGLTQAAYRAAGVSLPRVAQDQFD